jgi:hypothetical protein
LSRRARRSATTFAAAVASPLTAARGSIAPNAIRNGWKNQGVSVCSMNPLAIATG